MPHTNHLPQDRRGRYRPLPPIPHVPEAWESWHGDQVTRHCLDWLWASAGQWGSFWLAINCSYFFCIIFLKCIEKELQNPLFSFFLFFALRHFLLLKKEIGKMRHHALYGMLGFFTTFGRRKNRHELINSLCGEVRSWPWILLVH